MSLDGEVEIERSDDLMAKQFTSVNVRIGRIGLLDPALVNTVHLKAYRIQPPHPSSGTVLTRNIWQGGFHRKMCVLGRDLCSRNSTFTPLPGP